MPVRSAGRSWLWPDGFLISSALVVLVGMILISRRSWSGHSQIGLLILSLAGWMLVLLLGGAPFLLGKPARKRVALASISTMCTMYLLDLLLSLIPANDAFREAAHRFGHNFDTRSPLQFMRDRQAHGETLYPRLGGAHFLEQPLLINAKPVIPLGSISSSPTFIKFETGAFLRYQSDEHGFHNPAGLWSGDALDIVAVGDSFTLGCSVGSDENFVALIRKRYPKTLNLGQGGNGPLLMLAGLKEYAAPYKPKTVLWFHFEGNDLEDLNMEQTSAILMAYLQGAFQQGLIHQQAKLDELMKHRIAEMASLEHAGSASDALLAFLKLRHLRQRCGLLLHPPPDLELFARLLAEARATVHSWNGRLVFVYLPSWERYARRDVTLLRRAEVLDVVRGLGIQVVDMDATFASESDPLSIFPYRLSGHYNAKGHRAVSQRVLTIIQEILSPNLPHG